MTEQQQREERAREIDVKEYIGKRIGELRKEKKISQEALADALGYTRTSLVNIEAGRQSPPTTSIWIICNILHCTPNDLFPKTIPVEYKYEEVEKTIQVKVPKSVKTTKLILPTQTK